MSKKKHQIVTIGDALDAIENESDLTLFLEDLKNVILTSLTIKMIAELSGEEVTGNDLLPNGFLWINDGKNDFDIKFKAKEK